MPIFKVLAANREVKVSISANSLQNLKARAIPKLMIEESPELCFVYDDSDGAEIDDDDVLLEMAKNAAAHNTYLNVMILPVGTVWSKAPVSSDSTAVSPTVPSASSPTPCSSREALSSSQSTTPASNISCSPSPRPGPSTIHTTTCIYSEDSDDDQSDNYPETHVRGVFHDSDVVSGLKAALLVPEHQRNAKLLAARRGAAQAIAKYLYKYNMCTAQSIQRYCQQIYSQCPEAFKITINGQTAGNHLGFFQRSVTNMLNYKKQDTEKCKKKQAARQISLRLAGNNGSNKGLCLDEYGCVKGMWDPPLPDEETEESQEEKRKTLVDHFVQGRFSEPALSPDLKTLINETYPTQRTKIINVKSNADMEDIFIRKWPFMLTTSFLFEHSKILIGKSASQTFYDELNRSAIFVDYMYSFCTSNQNPSKGFKKTEMLRILEDQKKATANLQCEQATSKAVFPLLVYYLKEDLNKFLLLLSDTASDQDVLEAARSASLAPIIVVRGKSLFEEGLRCCVVLHGKYIIQCNHMLEAVLSMMLSFYCFAIAYPKGLTGSLEFIQRFFLSLNPSSDDGTSSRKNLSTKVLRLCEALASHEQRNGRWAP